MAAQKKSNAHDMATERSTRLHRLVDKLKWKKLMRGFAMLKLSADEKRAAMRMIGRFFARVKLDGFVLV